MQSDLILTFISRGKNAKNRKTRILLQTTEVEWRGYLRFELGTELGTQLGTEVFRSFATNCH